MQTDARQSLGTNIILGQVKNVLEKYPKCPGMSWICPGNCFSKKSGHPATVLEKMSYKNKFKISTPTWNDEFKSPVGSYFLSDIQDYFKYVIRKHELLNSRFKIKSEYHLDLYTPETIEIFESTRKDNWG